jgi:hypothetical protein
MKLIFTLTDGTTFEAKSIKVGDSIKITYTNSEGKQLIYWLKMTNNEKLVLN